MDLIEDEPRKHPIPVPFCQSSILKPTVPEVSLILQDNFDNQSEKKNDSFSGTEFQTYNAWRWKHMKGNDKTPSIETKTSNKCSNFQDCCVIKDRYSSSDIEKRKNEILYGYLDEPRRPLPPRADPVIPKCGEDVFRNNSFGDDIKNNTVSTIISSHERNISQKDSKLQDYKDYRKELDNSESLYHIITEQRKQTEVLQNQIKQLLKLQEVKDKQIEQLLTSQESKEKKIKQLLQSLDLKDREVEQLLKLKEKQEKQLQELLKLQEIKQTENLGLLKKLKDMQSKDVCTVGVMTEVQKVDASISTSLNCGVQECCNRRSENVVQEKDISCIRDLNDTNEFGVKDKTLSLHSADLPVIEEHVPTPQSSIHVDIQEFHDSSDESDSDSGTLSINFPASSEIQSSSLGYTFYNNVLTQVKDIIQNSVEIENEKNGVGQIERNQQVTNQPQKDCNYAREKRGTLQSFQAWSVFERENMPPSNEVKEGNNPPERLLYEPTNIYCKDTYSPSDISLKINALALKYLKQEQISQYDLQPQMSTPRQPDVTIYNVTNLSFGSMRYMDRYQIFPKIKENQQHQEINLQQNECSPAQLLRRKKKMTVEENLNAPIGNILDISTINQQPKLL